VDLGTPRQPISRKSVGRAVGLYPRQNRRKSDYRPRLMTDVQGELSWVAPYHLYRFVSFAQTHVLG
jgi:hypothetical protein